MNKSILAVGLSLVCGLAVNAQKVDTRATGDASSQTSGAVSQGAGSINLESGTRLAGELQNTVDVRKAKVGDQVVLKTTQSIKSKGRTVVGKGAKLIGRVTEVGQKSKDDGKSHLGILFDRLEQGSLAVPISATISSITSGSANVRRNDEDLFGTSASSSARSSSSARTPTSENGGLVGGVVNSTTSTIGSVVGGATSAVGSTVNSTTGAVGGVGSTLGRIQIAQSSSTSVEGSSVLSLQGGNLRLDKGTNFNLVLTQSASVGTSKNQ